MSFVGWLQLAYAVEGPTVVPVLAEYRNCSFQEYPRHSNCCKVQGGYRSPFPLPVELIIASDAGEKKGKELHCETEFLLGFNEIEKDFSSISEASIG